jgi:PAS domain S-box-containing protein
VSPRAFESAPSSARSLRFVTLAAVATAMVVAIGAWVAFSGSQTVLRSLRQARELERAATEIRYLDEIIARSALMAATTGAGEWEERYRAYAARLDSVLDAAIAAAPGDVDYAAGLREADVASSRLGELVQEAFGYSRAGQLEVARAILLSDDYGALRQDYVDGIGMLESTLRNASDDLVQAEELRRASFVLVATVVFLLLVAAWAAIYRVSRRWAAAHETQRAALEEKSKELERANEGLEERVRERTEGLRASEAALKRSMLEVEASLADLRRSEASYAALFDNAPLAICRASTDGSLLAVNPAMVSLLGYDSIREVSALDLGEDVFADASELAEIIEASRGAGLPSRDVRWKVHGEESRVVRVRAALVEADNGSEELELIAEDVTELQEVEAQLRQAQKMEAVGQLTGGIAHDFNNLLSIVLSNAELARGVVRGESAELVSLITEIQDAAKRGAGVVRRLLGFSRHGELSPRSTDLGELTEGFAKMLKRVIPETIDFRVVIDGDLPAVRVDPTSVEQIVLNLVSNARDAMSAGGSLKIRVSERDLDEEYVQDHPWADHGRHVCLAVQDNGCGMDAQTKKNIFNPFFTTKGAAGTGLGMAMVYGLVRQQGGFLQVYSEVGEGTTVNVYWPISSDEASRYTPLDETAEPEGGTETILLVEDEPALARAATRVLETNGYTVLRAPNGVEGLKMYQTLRDAIDLVLSDWVMPEMGGRELREALLQQPEPPRMLFASGYALGDGGGKDVLDDVAMLKKPWTIRELLLGVRNALDRA